MGAAGLVSEVVVSVQSLAGKLGASRGEWETETTCELLDQEKLAAVVGRQEVRVIVRDSREMM